jgi:hypothetical protein
MGVEIGFRVQKTRTRFPVFGFRGSGLYFAGDFFRQAFRWLSHRGRSGRMVNRSSIFRRSKLTPFFLLVVGWLFVSPVLGQVTNVQFPQPPYTIGETYAVTLDYDGSFDTGSRLGVLLELPSGELFGPVGEAITDGAVVDFPIQFSIPLEARHAESIRLAAYRGNFNRSGRLDFTMDDLVVMEGVTAIFNSGPATNNGFNVYAATDRELITHPTDLSDLDNPVLRFNYWAVDGFFDVDPQLIPRLEYSIDGCASFQPLNYTTPPNNSSLPDHYLHQNGFPYTVEIPSTLQSHSEVHLRWWQPENPGQNTRRWQMYEARRQSEEREDINLNISPLAHAELVASEPEAYFSSTQKLSYCRIPVGSSSSAMTVTLTNAGTESLVFDNLVIGGDHAADFHVDGDGCSGMLIEPEAECSFEVTFSPTSQGTRNAQIVVEAGSGSDPLNIELEGVGVAPPLTFVPSPVDFGEINLGFSVTRMILILNTSAIARPLGTISLAGEHADEFEVMFNNCDDYVLAPGELCRVELELTPETEGPRFAQLEIPSNAYTTPDHIDLLGEAVHIEVSINPVHLDFGSLTHDESASLQFTIVNEGSVEVVINALLGPNLPFEVEDIECGPLPYLLAPEGACTIEVRVESGGLQGMVSDSIRVIHDAAGSPDTVTVTVNFEPPPSSADLAVSVQGPLHPIPRGASASFGITVSNQGPDAANVALAQLSLPQYTTLESLTAPEAVCGQFGEGLACSRLTALHADSEWQIELRLAVDSDAPESAVEGEVVVSAAEDDPDAEDNQSALSMEITDSALFQDRFED